MIFSWFYLPPKGKKKKERGKSKNSKIDLEEQDPQKIFAFAVQLGVKHLIEKEL